MPRIPLTVLATAINYSRALTVSVTPGASSARLVWNTCTYGIRDMYASACMLRLQKTNAKNVAEKESPIY